MSLSFFFVLEIIIDCFQRDLAFTCCHRPGLCVCNYVMRIFRKALVSMNQAILAENDKFWCSVGINISTTMKQ